MTHFDEKMKLRAKTEICPVPEGFNRRLETVLEELPQQRTAHRPRHLARKVIAAAAAVCLLAGLGTSLAVASERTVDPLSTTLETWNEVDLSVPVGVSASSLGWTVTVDSAFASGWHAYVLCTLSRDNGGTITPGEYGFQGWDWGQPIGSGGIQWLVDEDPTDNKLPFVFDLSSYNKWDMRGCTMRLTLTGLVTADTAENWAMLLLGDSEWVLEFTLPAESTVDDFALALSFELDGHQATLDLLRVSPMGAWAEFSSTEEAFAALNPTVHGWDWVLDYEPRLVLADGTVLWLEESGGAGDGSSYHAAYSVRERTITPADIAGLQIGDTVYPLNLQ